MAIYGVDVYSGSADSIIQDSHAQAVIIKATQGTYYVNPKCNHQWDLAGQLGKLRGLYHYAGGGDPVAEAQYFINNIKNYVGKAVLAVDWESKQNSAWGNTNWVRKFVDEVHRLTGVWPMIYVQESALGQVANCANDCALWVAKYPYQTNGWTLPALSVSSGAWSTITGWQFTGGDMDRDIFYLDKAGWNRLANPASTTQNTNLDKSTSGSATHSSSPTKPTSSSAMSTGLNNSAKDSTSQQALPATETRVTYVHVDIINLYKTNIAKIYDRIKKLYSLASSVVDADYRLPSLSILPLNTEKLNRPTYNWTIESIYDLEKAMNNIIDLFNASGIINYDTGNTARLDLWKPYSVSINDDYLSKLENNFSKCNKLLDQLTDYLQPFLEGR